jgi:hypothetical protein
VNLIAFFFVASNSSDLGVPEDRGIKMSRLLGSTAEPQTGSDLLKILNGVFLTGFKSQVVTAYQGLGYPVTFHHLLAHALHYPQQVPVQVVPGGGRILEMAALT